MEIVGIEVVLHHVRLMSLANDLERRVQVLTGGEPPANSGDRSELKGPQDVDIRLPAGPCWERCLTFRVVGLSQT